MFILQKLYSFSYNKTSLWSGEAKSKQGIKREKKQIKKEFESSPRLAFYCKTSNVFLGGDKWHNPFLCYCPSLHQVGQRTQLLVMMIMWCSTFQINDQPNLLHKKPDFKSPKERRNQVLGLFSSQGLLMQMWKKLDNGSLSLQDWFVEHSFDNVIIVQLSMDLYIV